VSDTLIFAIPSKGRLMESCATALAKSGIAVRKTGPERGYRGEIEGISGVEVAFVSASEIVRHLRAGDAHLGITGRDLVEEYIDDWASKVEIVHAFDFGPADVVVAVPDYWLDVRVMADLEEIAVAFRRKHRRRLRVATKYMNLTRRFFAAHDVASYRIVESLGATEGAPASGSADLIVDITTTGETLRANGLRVLDDGVILKSNACLVRSRHPPRTGIAAMAEAELLRRLAGSAARSI
jgi:ATP phosphoribosyltransferase